MALGLLPLTSGQAPSLGVALPVGPAALSGARIPAEHKVEVTRGCWPQSQGGLTGLGVTGVAVLCRGADVGSLTGAQSTGVAGLGAWGGSLCRSGSEPLLVGQEGAALEFSETPGTASLPTAQGKEGSWSELTEQLV